VAAHIDVPPGQYVVFAVSDTGTGMTRDVLEKACDPFFTTKREGEGTGLGLSMAYGFVRQSGGHFKIYSEPGHGTTIRMYFPRTLEAETDEPTYLTGPVTGGTETILVVEDDLSVQSTVVEMLTSLGYRVLKADNAESALVILKSGLSIDLLFTDVVMPGELRSPELARQAKLLLPNIAVLFTSGYTQNAIVHGGRLDPGVHLISKPYRREQLARKIRHLLANQKQTAVARSISLSQDGSEKKTASSGKQVLVVEDNDDARTMVCEILGMMGYEAIGVASGEEALDAIDADGPDILFTDFGLPGINGVEVAKRLQQVKPDLRIIFASGYGDTISHADNMKAVTITKPYDLDTLEEVFKQVESSCV
jgi:CheY-like chemotaxis protein